MTGELLQKFFESIRVDDVSAVAEAIRQDPKIVGAVNPNGVSAILFSLYARREAVTNLLLSNGAEVDLYAAAALGDAVRLQSFISSGASLAKYSMDGWTALHLAAFFGKKDAVALLLKSGASVGARSTNALNNHPLHAAAAGGSRDVVALLLEHGADVNAPQSGGWTPLHAAAQSADVEMAKLLLAHGANADVRADNGQNALDLAMGKGAQPLVDLLMEAPRAQ